MFLKRTAVPRIALPSAQKRNLTNLKAGELMCERYTGRMVLTSEVERDEDDYYGFDSYDTLGGDWLETDITPFTTPSGDKMVAICLYGHD